MKGAKSKSQLILAVIVNSFQSSTTELKLNFFNHIQLIQNNPSPLMAGQWILVPCNKENCPNYQGYWSKTGKQRLDFLKTPCENHKA